MRFSFIDHITALEPGKSIQAEKLLTGEEDYLRDHFPLLPVMPGVLMLETMFQACEWLVRKSEDFAHSVVILKEARNVKFADFVQPGQRLCVSAKILKQDENTVTLKAEGAVDGKTAVSARLVLERYDLKDRHQDRAATDPLTRMKKREHFESIAGAHE